MAKLLTIALICVLIISNLYSQSSWSVIKPPYPPATSGNGYPQVTFPNIIYPIANNKIIYAGSVQYSPSGGGYIIAYRADDAGNKTTILSSSAGTGYSPYMIGAASYNDSTFCLSHSTISYGISYTNTGFKNSYSCVVGGGAIHSVFNTKRHLFILLPLSSYTADTLMFKRVTTGASQADTAVYLPNYRQFYPYEPKMTFINDSVGFILARSKANPLKAILVKTENYGDNWHEVLTDSVNQISAFSYPSANTGYVLKTDGSVYKTSDGGSAWFQVGSPSPIITSSVSCIKFSNDSVGYIGGPNGALAKTTNGGISWSNENTGSIRAVKSIFTFGDSVYFLTSTGTLYKNRAVTPPDSSRLSTQKGAIPDLLIYPNPSNDIIHLEFTKQNTEHLTITITNVLGEEIYREENDSQDLTFKTSINIKGLPKGIYFVRANNAGKNSVQQLAVTH